jgi:FtsP/CotA-like multicopper oxidase with cupredoxin domain
MPGQTYTYRFRAEQTGTYWYHSHQQSLEEVREGLYGTLIVDPKTPAAQPPEKDISVAAHIWEGEQPQADGGRTGKTVLFGSSDTLEKQTVAPGTTVRLRLINTDTDLMTFYLAGTPFKVAAIDGTNLNAPTDLQDVSLPLAAGGRYDITFTMPDAPVLLRTKAEQASQAGLLFSAAGDGDGTIPAIRKGPAFDPATYGSPAPTPFGLQSRFDRNFVMVLDQRMGFYDGQFRYMYTINGRSFPDTPMFMVQQGELVKTTFVNHSAANHPMHLHGHHMLVLSRNGKPASGSPWWTDTLNVGPGETYEVAFRADNPGIWMDHCHNLQHASVGMMVHLAYEGVTTPFAVGRATGNHPE